MAEPIPLEQFQDHFGTAIELSSIAIGGRVISVSDEFFAEAFHLLLVEPAQSLKGQFGPNGALYSGWESRRHNPAHDWCVIKLGTSGFVFGFDIDTTHFNGNEAPQVSVDAAYIGDETEPRADDPRWFEILPKVDLGPSSRHLFKITTTDRVNHVKLNMYPDGGIARFRVYGAVSPVFPAEDHAPFDLAHAFAGGRVVFTSDQHFGVGSNLIIPGRGKDMGDGWETKRSRQPDHKDWTIIQLGTPGYLSYAEIDTAHFKGNFPESCELHATSSETGALAELSEESAWTQILPRTKLGPHKQHYFQLENVGGRTFSHVRLTIHPDGGVKRVRIIGTRAPPLSPPSLPSTTEDEASIIQPIAVTEQSSTDTRGPTIPALPLTAEAFAPFGHVVQAYADLNGAPRGTRITPANNGSATKFYKLSPVLSSYPSDSSATLGLSVYRCSPVGARRGGRWEVKQLERHAYTNQAFIPMGGRTTTGTGADALEDAGEAYLVVVAQNGADDRPKLSTMRAFLANAGQGIVYQTGIWHHPMLVLEKPMDFTCVETQIGDGSLADCEVVDLDASNGFHTVNIPAA